MNLPGQLAGSFQAALAILNLPVYQHWTPYLAIMFLHGPLTLLGECGLDEVHFTCSIALFISFYLNFSRSKLHCLSFPDKDTWMESWKTNQIGRTDLWEKDMNPFSMI